MLFAHQATVIDGGEDEPIRKATRFPARPGQDCEDRCGDGIRF
jgi:hypothetical protein